jgi:hypothetical protein
MDLRADCWLTHNVTTINVFEQIIDYDQIYPLPMDEFNAKKYMLWMTIRSMDAANRVLLRSSIYLKKNYGPAGIFTFTPMLKTELSR